MAAKSKDYLRIDINDSQVRKVVCVRQGDTIARTLCISIVNAGVPIDLTNCLVAEILIKKADGYEADNGCVLTNSEVQYTLRSTDIAALGENFAQIMLTFKDGEVLTTPTFVISVYSQEMNPKVTQSFNEYTSITQQVVMADQYATEASEAAASATASEIAVAELAAEAIAASEGIHEDAESVRNSIATVAAYEATTKEHMEMAQSYAQIAENDVAYLDGNIQRSEDAAQEAENYKILAKEYKDAAKASEDAAKASEDAAADSATAAQNAAETAAAEAAEQVTSLISGYKASAEEAANNALTYSQNAENSAATALTAAQNAAVDAAADAAANVTEILEGYANAASQSATNAATFEAGAENYYEQTKAIAEGVAGTLIPIGTVTFEALPSVDDVSPGWMYNISDEFVTTDDFKEGAGHTIPLGSNVYLTADSKWDVLAGSPVTGIKGNAEATYRRGNVNITASDLGLSSVATSGSYNDLTDTPSPYTLPAASIDSLGGVKADGTTITVDADGTIHGVEQGDYLNRVNPKGEGSLEIGYDNLAYGIASVAEGGYTTSTSFYTANVDSISISDDIATIGLTFSQEFYAKSIYINSLSRNNNRNTIWYKLKSIKLSDGTTDLTVKGKSFICEAILITDEQKTDIANVNVGDTLYSGFAGTTALGENSHAEGSGTVATGNASHAEGSGTVATGNASHAEGSGTVATGHYSHSENLSTKAIGQSAHAEGCLTTANANYSHAEGYGTTADGTYSHAEGYQTVARSASSHAEGNGTVARGLYSHAEGCLTTASAERAHAEGYNTTASNQSSHAEGYSTTASGYYSHAQNYFTKAAGYYQTALGKYNVEDTTNAVIIGNGASDTARSNALTVDFDGNVVIAGDAKTKKGGSERYLLQNDVYNDSTSTTTGFACNSITTSKTDLTAGTSSLTSGQFYVVYE